MVTTLFLQVKFSVKVQLISIKYLANRHVKQLEYFIQRKVIIHLLQYRMFGACSDTVLLSLVLNVMFSSVLTAPAGTSSVSTDPTSATGTQSRLASSVRQLTKNERIAHFFERIAHSLIFWQKTSDLLGNQMSKFPGLIFFYFFL